MAIAEARGTKAIPFNQGEPVPFMICMGFVPSPANLLSVELLIHPLQRRLGVQISQYRSQRKYIFAMVLKDVIAKYLDT